MNEQAKIAPETIAARAREIAATLRRHEPAPLDLDLSLAILDQAAQAASWRTQLGNAQRKIDRMHLDSQRQQRAHVRLRRALRQKVQDFEALRGAVLVTEDAVMLRVQGHATRLGLTPAVWKRPARAVLAPTPSPAIPLPPLEALVDQDRVHQVLSPRPGCV